MYERRVFGVLSLTAAAIMLWVRNANFVHFSRRLRCFDGMWPDGKPGIGSMQMQEGERQGKLVVNVKQSSAMNFIVFVE